MKSPFVLGGTLWSCRCTTGINFIVLNEINPTDCRVTEVRQTEVYQRMFFLFIIVLIIMIMTCTAIRSWRCCHGCSKLSSHFKIKENVLSRLCISATHVENLSNRRKKKKSQNCTTFSLVWAVPHFLSLSTSVSSVRLLVRIPSAWWPPFSSGALSPPRQERQLSTNRHSLFVKGFFFSLQKKHKMQKEDEWVLVSE